MINNPINNPKVSILVPLYNQERYIDACLSSICNQTYKNLEIVIVNDGSTDRSPLMAKEWASRDSRIKVVDKQNEGLTYARRDGYREATGDYIAFVDSDDMLTPRAIEILVHHMLDKNVDLVLGGIVRKLGFLKKKIRNHGIFPIDQVVTQPELFDKYYIGFFGKSCFTVSMWGRLFKKSIIDRALQETELFSSEIRFMGEDEHFNVMIFPYLNSMYMTDEAVYYYRYGGAADNYNRFFPELLNFSTKRLGLLDKYNYSEGYQYLFAEYVAIFFQQAKQLIAYNKADKHGIMEYFKNEMETNALVPRLIEYYTQNGSKKPEVQLMINHDYEGMYDYAVGLITAGRKTLRYKVKRLLFKLMKA